MRDASPLQQACWAPSAELPSLPFDVIGETHVAAAVASLLYFDSVYCPTLATVPEIGPELQSSIPGPVQLARLARDPRVARLLAGKADHGLTINEWVGVYLAGYIRARKEFEDEYTPLWKENIVIPLSFCKALQNLDSSKPAEHRTVRGWAHAFVDQVVPHLAAVIPERQEYADYANWVVDVYQTSSSIAVAAAYVREALEHAGAQRFLASDRVFDLAIFSRIVLLFDVFCRRILTGPLPTITACEGYLHLQELMAREVFVWQTESGLEHSRQQSIAHKIATHCVAELPVPFPRSIEAIIHVRQALAPELEAFRTVVTDAAENVLLSDRDSPANIHGEFTMKLARPLRDLRRRLGSPNRELIRNLVSNQSIITAVAVSLMAGASTGINDVSAAILGIAAPTLTAAIRTLLDRGQDIRRSGLAFLLRLSDSQ